MLWSFDFYCARVGRAARLVVTRTQTVQLAWTRGPTHWNVELERLHVLRVGCVKNYEPWCCPVLVSMNSITLILTTEQDLWVWNEIIENRNLVTMKVAGCVRWRMQKKSHCYWKAAILKTGWDFLILWLVPWIWGLCLSGVLKPEIVTHKNLNSLACRVSTGENTNLLVCLRIWVHISW